MQLTRRTFLKASAATGATVAASRFLFGPLTTLGAADESDTEGRTGVIDEWVPTTCWIGKQDCGMLAHRIDGRVVKLEGHPGHPRNMGTLCPKGVGQITALYDPNRVKTPLIRTNAKGEKGEFRAAGWDEALGMVAEKMNEVRERDPRLLIWQKGRSKAKAFYDTAFVKASGATKLHHGAYCSDAGYRACEYTVGPHGVLHPDFRNTDYVLAWGWNITSGGGNKTCWLTWNQQLVEARERGLKVVVIDPRVRAAGAYADKWLPIKPGTDLALALALCNLVIGRDTLDRDYLRKYSNAGYLVKEDGKFLRIDDVEQVWDEVTGGPMPHDAEGVTPALEGQFVVGTESVRPGFQVFKEHVAGYTAEWAANECGLNAADIREIAADLGDKASIGSTRSHDGVDVPHRPVSIMTYHVSQQELGFQQVRAQVMLMMLLGAMGASGGTMVDWTWKIHKNYAGLDNIEITDTPNVYLNKSKFYPINSNNSSVVAQVMNNPEEFGVDYVPEVAILHMVNPLSSFLSEADLEEAYKKFKFVAVIDPWLSRTADMFADVILPAATMEKYEGPLSGTDQYTDAVSLRVPIQEPLGQSRGDIQIYLDLCEAAGILFGEDGYLDQVNQALGLSDEFAMPLDRKPTEREIFDNWSKDQGIEEGVSFFEREGVLVKGPVSAKKRYGYAMDEPFGGAIHRLYGESLLGYQEEMRERGVSENYWKHYTALPTWQKPIMEGSPPNYDLTLISYKLIEFKQGRASQSPLLSELAPTQRLDINPETASARGLEDGDSVLVESQNAITGATRSLTTVVHTTAAIRPDTVAMPHHYGEIARSPVTKGQGPTPNVLFFTGEGYTANTGDQSFHVKVRVEKA